MTEVDANRVANTISDTKPVADPFELSPQIPEQAIGAAVLCLHGLTGTPYEVRLIAEMLSSRGFHCLGPLLPGHAGSPAELARTTSAEWLECARRKLADLHREFEQVAVVGMSMGALVSLVLAAEGSLDAVVSIGAPLRFHPMLRLGIPIAKYLYRFKPKKGGSDIRDDEARARHPGMKVMPLASVHELMRLQRRVSHALPRITAPILVAHGALDHTANPRDARRIFGAVNSESRELDIYPNSGHLVPVDLDRDALASDIASFLLAQCRQWR